MYELESHGFIYKQPTIMNHGGVYFKYFKDITLMTQYDAIYIKEDLIGYGGQELFLLILHAIQHVPCIYLINENKFREKWESEDSRITRYYYEVKND